MFDFFKKRKEEKKLQLEKIRLEEERKLETERRLEEELRLEEERKLETERRLEEELRLKIDAQLENELKNNLLSLNNVLTNMSSMHKLLINFLQMFDVIINLNDIYDVFCEVYKISYNVSNIIEFKEEVKEKTYEIIRDKLKVDLDKKVNKQYLYLNIQESIESSMELRFSKNIEDLLIYELLTGTPLIIPELIESANDGELQSIDKEEAECKRFYLMRECSIYIYLYIVALVKILMLSKEKYKIENNAEFFKIQKNIYNEFDINEMIDKIYPIYIEFYKDISEYVYNERELQVIIYLINMNKDKNLNLIQDLTNIIKESSNLNEELSKTLDMGLINKFEENINYESILEIIKGIGIIGVYNLDEEDIVKNIYCEIIKEMKDKVSGKEIFELYQNVDNIITDIRSFSKKQSLMKDKERFLNGDFTKEKEIENEKLRFNLLKTGIEFEEYLKYIFEKKGYTVELTKTTGDQGADLIINKDNIKIVVQAKFYSSPVGNKAVQEVVSAIGYYNANNGMVITNSCYTKSAIELADANNIVLWDGDKLKEEVEMLYSK